MSEGESKSADPNPFEVGAATQPNPFLDPARPRPPGPVAIFFSVVLGLAVAAATFGVTFFFTCLGVDSSPMKSSQSALPIVFGVSGLTALGAFVFTVWGLLKLGKLFRS